MKIQIGFAQAGITYSDSTKHPTPEHAEDIMRRMERSLHRMWLGKAPEAIELDEHEASTTEADDH